MMRNIHSRPPWAEYMNFNALDGMDELLKERGINYQQVYADQPGIVSYAIDSYEGMTASDISEASFDRTLYKRSFGKAGDLIENGTPGLQTDHLRELVRCVSSQRRGSDGLCRQKDATNQAGKHGFLDAGFLQPDHGKRRQALRQSRF